jgi:TonB family protein
MTVSTLRAMAAAATFALLFFASVAKSDAMAELCPASLERMTPNVSGVAAPAFTYELHARSVRTISKATMIADTDHGWFQWSADDIELMAATVMSTTRFGSYAVKIGRSAQLDVTFPQPLTVRRAWIERAAASGPTPGWGDKGEVPCQVPAFPSRDADAAELALEASLQFVPANPPTGAPPSKAVAATVPFATIDCAAPFRNPVVTDASAPEFPDGARELVLNQTTTQVEVSLDELGHLIDASVYVSSGNALLDESALRAARKSSYSGPISYCQNVRGQYLFSATFRP